MPPAAAITLTSRDWLTQTALPRKPRSVRLVAVDKALAAYEADGGSAPGFASLRRALVVWQRSRANPEPSARNGPARIVDALSAQIAKEDAAQQAAFAQRDPAAAKALAYVRSQQRETLNAVFNGKTLQWRDARKAALQKAREAAKELESARQEITKAVTGGDGANADEAANQAEADTARAAAEQEVFGGIGPQALFDALGLGPVDAFKASLKALFAQAKTPVTLASAFAKVAKGRAQQRRIGNDQIYAFGTGDAEAAVQAVQELLQAQIRHDERKLAQETANAVALLASSGIAGPLVAAANAVLNAVMVVMDAARDYAQVQAGRELLARSQVDVSAFETCPLLGCYYLVCAGDSVVLDWAHNDLGQAHFDKTVLALKAKAAPVMKLARDYIDKSPFVLADPKAPDKPVLDEAAPRVDAVFRRASVQYKAALAPPPSSEDLDGPVMGSNQADAMDAGATHIEASVPGDEQLVMTDPPADEHKSSGEQDEAHEGTDGRQARDPTRGDTGEAHGR
jgi:hypothetical protein